jgi:cysteinyl-tRNA synthetase
MRPSLFRRLDSRRAFLASALAGLTFLREAVAGEPSIAVPGGRRAAHKALDTIRTWGCQYQNVDLAKIAASDLDLIVIDPSLDDDVRRFVTRAERAALQRKPDGARRIALGYLSVGEADVNRWYWPPEWQRSVPPWVGQANPNWPGARHVKFWSRQWQALIFRAEESILDKIIDIGFDGVLLDRVDAYLDWERQRASAQDEMVDLVADLVAKARAKNPDFIVLVQNAEHLLVKQRYLELIDAHNKESLLTGLGGKGVPNRPADIAWSLTYLGRAQRAGIKMLATEYLSDPAAIKAARARLVSLGFLPFFGNRQLDRLPAPASG